MTERPDPPLRILRSLPLTIFLVTALFSIVWPFVSWLGLLPYPESIPPWPVWTDYLAIRAVAGVCVGASLYVVSRLSGSWLRMCLYWILFFVLTGGDVDDFARWSLGRWLSIWLVGSLITGVLIGSVFNALERRSRAR
jgi:hypothetical protein